MPLNSFPIIIKTPTEKTSPGQLPARIAYDNRRLYIEMLNSNTDSPPSSDIALEYDAGGNVRIEAAFPISPDTTKQIKRLAHTLLMDHGAIDPEPRKRYLLAPHGDARRPMYAKMDRVSADNMIAHLPAFNLSIIEETSDVEPVYVTSAWAYWSDGKLTPSTGLPEWTTHIKRQLSEDAVEVLSSFMSSDSTSMAVGFEKVINLEAIEKRETMSLESAGGVYAGKRVECLTVRLKDGQVTTWWLYAQGYCEGYEYELHPSRESLLAAITPALTVAPSPEYTPMAGQLWEPCQVCGKEPVYMPLHRCEDCWPAVKAP